MKILFTITFFCFAVISYSQNRVANDEFIEIIRVDVHDSILTHIVRDYKDSVLLESKVKTLLIWIEPILNRADGVPKSLIDSLYQNVHFPGNYGELAFSISCLKVDSLTNLLFSSPLDTHRVYGGYIDDTWTYMHSRDLPEIIVSNEQPDKYYIKKNSLIEDSSETIESMSFYIFRPRVGIARAQSLVTIVKW